MPSIVHAVNPMIRLLDFSARVLTGAFALWALLAVAHADAPYSFAATPGQLPKAVAPVHYTLDLRPNLQALTVTGSAVIDIEVREPTDRLVLNAVDMTFTSALLDGVAPARSITVDENAQTVTLTFPRAIEVGRYKLRIAYSGKINKFGRGIYSIDYRADDGRKRMIASHSEPSDARRIFPGWDEPAFKATFDLTVTVPELFMAVSNMPIAREEPTRNGRKRVSFERTPKMSTYLFVLVAGELERLTGEAEGITIGVVTTRGKSANGRYAIDQTADLLKYFNDYFATKYPLPKLDLIALPSNSASAMEHWGGITFFESGLLYDPAKSSIETQRRVFSLLAHEIAHQWLGNLVTTAWWNDLWLNEGFASWMQYKAVDVLHPEWQPWFNSNSAKQGAMAQDARRGARAITQPVANETEARAVFDTITYSKGQAVVRMTETYLGEDVFRDAMRRYMKEHAYSNATSVDLWHALDAVSGKAVGSVASSYAEQPGVPLVIADSRCVGGEQRITLKQDRFSVRDPAAQPQRWQVPVRFGLPDGTGATVLLDGEAEIAAGRCGDAVKLNLGDVGYYRVRYDAAMQGALARRLASMAPVDRINLLADAWALTEANRNPPSAYFELADQLAGDDHRSVADQVIRTLTRVYGLQRGRPGQAAFAAYARGALRPMFDRIGWQAVDGEPTDRALLRTRLIRTLGDFGDEAVLAEAKRRFDAFQQDAASLPPNLRDSVTHLVGRGADRATYQTLLELGRKSTNTEERVRYYSALAAALDPALARETLAIALTEELPSDVGRRLIGWVAEAEHPDLAVEFVKNNFETLATKLGSSFRNTFVSNLMANFSDPARAEELKQFAPAYETSGGRMVAERTRERILADAELVAEQMPAIDEWVRRRRNSQ
jgi:aminopeptidase N